MKYYLTNRISIWYGSRYITNVNLDQLWVLKEDPQSYLFDNYEIFFTDFLPKECVKLSKKEHCIILYFASVDNEQYSRIVEELWSEGCL